MLFCSCCELALECVTFCSQYVMLGVFAVLELTNYGSTDAVSTSGSSSPDHELNLESSKLLAGSYTILNGEIKLDRLPSSSGDSEEVKKVPPAVPPKPQRPGNLNAA